MKKLCWSIIISLYSTFFSLYSQPLSLSQKKIGVLISRKNLQVDGYASKFWAAYLQVRDSIGLTEENLKTAVSIQVGKMLQKWLLSDLQASKAYFLNEGKQFEDLVKSYPFTQRPATPVPLDGILVVDTLHFLSKKENIVFSFSNKLHTEQQVRLTVYGKITFYQLEPFQVMKEKFCWIEEGQWVEAPVPVGTLPFKIEKLVGSWLNESLR